MLKLLPLLLLVGYGYVAWKFSAWALRRRLDAQARPLDEYLIDGVNAVRVPIGDAAALGRALDALMADPEAARALARLQPLPSSTSAGSKVRKASKTRCVRRLLKVGRSCSTTTRTGASRVRRWISSRSPTRPSWRR